MVVLLVFGDKNVGLYWCFGISLVDVGRVYCDYNCY